MTLPFFYIESYNNSSTNIVLNEETSKHVVQVLRMKNGEQLNLTDGKGNLLTATITDAHKKNCVVKITDVKFSTKTSPSVSIAISLIKNTSRFEWFLEKATEIGVAEIVPLICERTERQHFRHDRMKGIVVSAMLQSQQTWLPDLREPMKLKDYLLQVPESNTANKFIAHCIDEDRQSLSNILHGADGQMNKFSSSIILIGPEGDFTEDEIQLALRNQFAAITLGETRLRTETAGVVAAALLCIK